MTTKAEAIEAAAKALLRCSDMCQGCSESAVPCYTCRLRAALALPDAPAPAPSERERERELLTASYLADFFDAKARWSHETFGPGDRLLGVLAHIRKELIEIEAEPGDVEEWVDVVMLAMDGAWRCAGASGADFAAALFAKHEKNIARTWPNWRTASRDAPIEHVREVSGTSVVVERAAAERASIAEELRKQAQRAFADAERCSLRARGFRTTESNHQHEYERVGRALSQAALDVAARGPAPVWTEERVRKLAEAVRDKAADLCCFPISGTRGSLAREVDAIDLDAIIDDARVRADT